MGVKSWAKSVAGRRPRLPRGVRARRWGVQAVMAGCVLALLPSAWTHAAAADRLGTTAQAPAGEVAVVFGAGLWNGRPTPYLANRLDAAAELYRAGKVKVVLVTGDNSRTEYDEPNAMRTYLTGQGCRETGSSAISRASTPGTRACGPRRSSGSTGPC